MNHRYIFTTSRPSTLERIADHLLAIALGVAFAVMAVIYFS